MVEKGKIGHKIFLIYDSRTNHFESSLDIALLEKIKAGGDTLVIAEGKNHKKLSGHAKQWREISKLISVEGEIVRSYLSTPAGMGLLSAEAGEIDPTGLVRLKSIYENIVIFSSPDDITSCEMWFREINCIFILASADDASQVCSENIVKGLREMQIDESLIFCVQDVGGGGEKSEIKRINEIAASIDCGRYLIDKNAVDAPDDAVRTQIDDKILKEISASAEIQKLLKEGKIYSEERETLCRKVETAVGDFMEKGRLHSGNGKDAIVKEVIDHMIGLGPLEVYMGDPSVSEIMVNSRDEIYVERSGRIEKTSAEFSGDKALMTVIERIIAPVGRRVDESSPVVDARLPCGSRVHVIIPPLALNGPTVTIRKFSRDIYSADALISRGSMNQSISLFLKDSVERKNNILISGGTGSGKTTMLNVLSSFIPERERIITIEDSAELKLCQSHVVRLESRPRNIEGEGEVSIRDLVKASLRMRPDRIIVGECRGAEALDMLQAMNTGHDGSLTTLHANSARDALGRLETLVLFAGFEIPVKAIREQIVSAINLVVQIKRFNDGTRRIVNISEVTGMEGNTITMQDIFVYENGSFHETGFGGRGV